MTQDRSQIFIRSVERIDPGKLAVAGNLPAVMDEAVGELLAARLAAESEDLLPQSLLADVRRYDRGVLKAEDTRAESVSGQDPVEWVKLLKDKLKARY